MWIEVVLAVFGLVHPKRPGQQEGKDRETDSESKVEAGAI